MPSNEDNLAILKLKGKFLFVWVALNKHMPLQKKC